jgi:uncharacterized LabA/DUF88 family protein
MSKVSILIDGGFFVQRFRKINKRSPKINDVSPFLAEIMDKVTALSPESKNSLLRSYYYDCKPCGETKTDPNGRIIDFSQLPTFKAASTFQHDLKTFPQLALRPGDLSFNGWKIDEGNSGNFIPDFKQKSVDIKLGLDIAWMSSKKTVDKIVLVAGDSDFVTPMKFARREGLLVYLYPMQQANIKLALREHADFILS